MNELQLARSERIGIVGGSGFIGGAVKSLADSLGADLIGISGKELSSAGVDALRDLLADHQLDSLLLSVGVARGVENRGLGPAARTHLISQIYAALPGLRELKSLVWMGSGSEYGAAKQPYDEDALPAPSSRYGLAKLHESNIFLSLKSQGVPVWVVRPSVVFGKGQRPGMLIPSLVSSISSGKPFVLQAPSDTRDFLHVDDLADLILRCLISRDGGLGVINAATGREHSVLEVAHLICGRLGMPHHLLEIVSKSDQSLEPRQSFSIRKAREYLGWEPKISLTEGIERLLHD